MGLLDDLNEKILIGDGAMGTLLYANGINSCFEELNLSHPQQVLAIHQSYLDAGATVIQTNTYGANYPKLAGYGLQDHVKEINSKAVRLAKEAAQENAYVLGTIGGIRGIKKGEETIEELKRSFREQLYCLLLEGVDGILFETYYDLEELTTMLAIARKETDLPLIAQVSLHEPGTLQNGTPLADALIHLETIGADVVGLNCRLGPYHMIRSLEQVDIPQNAFLSAYPNAGLPEYVDGKLTYQSDPKYFEESALSFRAEGVRLIGGCCGTTPRHIEAMAKKLAGLKPVTRKTVKKREASISVTGSRKENQSGLHELARDRRSIIVELDPPKKLNIEEFFKGAKALEQAGIDALTLADNSLATPRVSNLSIASMLKNQLNQRSLVHVACRDRNLIGLQSHLMGLHALGIHDVLAITGDPTKVGNFPGATSVYDCNSFDLIQLCKQFNEGISYSGKSLGEKTNFSIAGAFNPNVHHLDKAVRRLEKKIHAGADYFLTQPIFSEQQMIEVYHATKQLNVPIYIGIMPLTSSQNAEFLHNEVPGIKLSQTIRERLALFADNRPEAVREGIAIAKSLLDAAMDLFNGIYLITPFMRYDMTVELVEYINAKKSSVRSLNLIEK
ncbi:bifunctional homocysteine S-methyltransferase/methylenetetrahydrofolate reductase [Virgibacillus phasianinus]|uniref:Bifunctional homocysteine S-methyltransferase/methylenetetrahydrofolate reductase n=1 Tax=Virgibacillus phasianinus TaxID=2017483 RepID=A0A220U243_9BACI|nr:bifunctional homocysteine S-methyltransferase/methylenetetrahydrofolate reductase [Virgibacillus phasianinus]ASK62170.1 bifunctional homocysteine S-methyltransferase/methylenetetrahydrofolate reductase [Virgibacillus phasianinus]